MRHEASLQYITAEYHQPLFIGVCYYLTSEVFFNFWDTLYFEITCTIEEMLQKFGVEA
jgi:hypothetical protein